MRGKWLIEVAELPAFPETETEALKAFITRRIERYRRNTARSDVIEPRQCLFVGTTNDDDYVRDETGGRRFWPVKVSRIDVDTLAAIASNCSPKPSTAIATASTGGRIFSLRNSTLRRDKKPSWKATRGRKEEIADYVAMLTRVRISEIATGALGFESMSRVGTADQRRIASVLQGLGWIVGRSNGVRFYRRYPNNQCRSDAERRTTHSSRAARASMRVRVRFESRERHCASLRHCHKP